MASCFGPDSKKAVLKELGQGGVKIITAMAMTCPLLVAFGAMAFPTLSSPSVGELAGMIVVISPIWLGFHEMASRMITPPIPWILRALLSAVITAAFSVWVLPKILLWFFTTLSELSNQISL
jgi:hypothetical protein